MSNVDRDVETRSQVLLVSDYIRVAILDSEMALLRHLYPRTHQFCSRVYKGCPESI